ncbi:MAG TPA: hypothetical protein VHT70_03080 [Candidatus Saccharimonadales bacterium]|jgi:tetratricopeptide (TPR) repeat protein|nr:hypothetical protein [Candidatus Saccharimonadales bacterium]
MSTEKAAKAKVFTEKSKQRGSLLRKLLIVLIVVLLAATAVTAAWRITHPPRPAAVQSALDAVGISMAAGDYQQAVVTLKNVLPKVTSKDDKVIVYDELASSYTSLGDVDDALHYYQLKHQLAPNTEGIDAYLVGTLYDRKNDKKNALDQYSKALTYYKTLKQTSQMKNQIQSLQAQIKELEAQ